MYPYDVNRLIVLASRLDPGPEARREMTGMLSRGPELSGLAPRAEEEGTLPLLHRNLKDLPGALPAPISEALRSGYLRNLARNTRIYKTLEPFLEAVRAKDLRVALTKGGRLALTVYPDVALRPFWDLDFIVHPADWPAAKIVLGELGYKEASGDDRIFDIGDASLHWAYSPYFMKDGLFLEFHFNFLGLHFPSRSGEGMWSSALRTAAGGTEVAILPAEHELCYLCLHAQQHSYRKLIWMTDIAELAARGDLDWDRVRGLCRDEKIAAPVFHAFRLVNALWPGTLSESLLAGFRPGPVARAGLRFLWPEAAVSARAKVLSWPYYMPTIFSLWERKDLGLARRTLSGILFPPRAWIVQTPGSAGSPVRVYKSYAKRLLRPLFMTVKRMVTRT